MQVFNYDWSKFPIDDSWMKELDHTNVPVFDVCNKILREISGHKKIKKFRFYSAFIDTPSKNKVEFEEDNVTLLKNSRALCFCKWDECTISETKVNDIEKIIFNKVYDDGKSKYFVICIKENSGFYWKYEIIV